MADARVLVVEDAEAIRAAVETGLRNAGHEVCCLPDGRSLERDLARFRPDVVVLDVMLPGRDGFALLPVVCEASAAGVVMLTARDAVDDRLRGLTGGADDYVVKPFVLAELVARVEALLRRLGCTRCVVWVMCCGPVIRDGCWPCAADGVAAAPGDPDRDHGGRRRAGRRRAGGQRGVRR